MNDRIAADAQQTEAALIEKAQHAISSCNWTLGECAAIWTKKYARGRTDSDFAKKIGLSADQVYQRRRVWEVFAEVNHKYPKLKWSHYYVALSWEDASDCLEWAQENQANVAQMRAWRRLQRGEDLTTDPETEHPDESLVSFVPQDPMLVRDPAAVSNEKQDRSTAPNQRDTAVTAAARDVNSSSPEYSPYRKGAGSLAPREQPDVVAVADRPQPSTAQIVKRMTTSLERCNRVLTAEFRQEFCRLPKKLQAPFIKAVSELSSKAAGLM